MPGSEYNPGSPEALGGGCTCDPELNRHGNGVLTPSDEPIFRAENGCPLHGLAVALDAIYNGEAEVIDAPDWNGDPDELPTIH